MSRARSFNLKQSLEREPCKKFMNEYIVNDKEGDYNPQPKKKLDKLDYKDFLPNSILCKLKKSRSNVVIQ